MPGPFSFFAPEGVMPGSFTGINANSLPQPTPTQAAPAMGANLAFLLPLALGMAAEAVAPKDSGAARAGQGAQMLARQAATSKYLEDLANGKASSVSPFLVDPGALMEGQRLKKYGEVSQAQLRAGEASRKSQEEQARLNREQQAQLASDRMGFEREQQLYREDVDDRNFAARQRDEKANAKYREDMLAMQRAAPILGSFYSNLFSPTPIYDEFGFQTGVQRSVDNWQIGPNGMPLFVGPQAGASGLGAALGAPGVAPPMTMADYNARTAEQLDSMVSGDVIEAPDLPQQKAKTTPKPVDPTYYILRKGKKVPLGEVFRPLGEFLFTNPDKKNEIERRMLEDIGL